MVDQATTDSEWEQRDIDQRLKRLEAFVGAMSEGGFDRFVESGIIQFDGIDMRLDTEGMKFTSDDSGDSFPSVPNAASIRWFRDTFTGDPVGEIAGGYSTPTTTDFATIAMRAFIDTFDGANAKVGVYDLANGRWDTLLAIQAGTGFQPLILSDWIASALTNILLVGRTDDDNYTLSVRRNGALTQVLVEGDVSGAMKVSGSGYEVYPSAASGVDPANSGSAWTNAAYSEIVASTAEAVYIVGVKCSEEDGEYEWEMDIATGAAASEVVVSTIAGGTKAGAAGGGQGPTIMLPHAIAVATTTRIACRVRSSSTTLEPDNVKLIYIDQDSLVAL